MKKWVDENKNQTDLIMTSTKMDWKNHHYWFENAVACWRGCFCSHGKSSGRIFYSGKKRIKTPFVHLKETQHNQCNESIKPMVCFKISR
jgi:hypothetical protein